MSMSEFERYLSGSEEDLSPPSVQAKGLPEDFTAEELAFAQELEELFVFEKEELPPYFAQTLLQPEDVRFQGVEDRFEQKVATRVFRRLRLRRRLYRSYQPVFPGFIKEMPMQRPLMALVAACLLFMIGTMIYTGPLFASGLSFLWSGAHSGVLLTRTYPQVTPVAQHHGHAANLAMIASPKEIDYIQAQNELHFPIYLPNTMPSNYDLDDIYLYQNENQSWADGPLVQLSYSYQLPGITPHGTGRIVICEFRPQGRVVQVVKFGSVQQIRFDGGQAQAVYVNGQWVRVHNPSHDWVYGVRSELIYEHNGVIFWIVGDQRDGVDSTVLSNIAGSLQSFNLRAMGHTGDDMMRVVEDSMNGSSWEYGFGGQIIYHDVPGAPSLSVVGAEPNQSSLDVPPNVNKAG